MFRTSTAFGMLVYKYKCVRYTSLFFFTYSENKDLWLDIRSKLGLEMGYGGENKEHRYIPGVRIPKIWDIKKKIKGMPIQSPAILLPVSSLLPGIQQQMAKYLGT